MIQVEITHTGNVDVLQLCERDNPIPNPDEVGLSVKAVGINFADVLARKGLYPDAPKIPFVPGYEVSGVVENVGSGLDESLIGKEVLSFTRFNGYSEKVIVPITQVFNKPESLSFEEAAAIPVTYMTAYLLLLGMGALKENESILIHNAGGGVGLAAIDIAKKTGAIVYGTASSHKHKFLLSKGLDYAIDYCNGSWVEEILELTSGKGVDLIIDPFGGSHWRKSFRVLKPIGRLGMFGISSVCNKGSMATIKLLKALFQMPFFHPMGLMNLNRGVFGVNLGHLWNEHLKFKEWMEIILEGVNEGWVKPHVDRVFGFDEVEKAHTYIEDRKNIGKVILVP